MVDILLRERIHDELLADADELPEPGLIAGRPIEDRGFEAVEAGLGLVAGVAIGSAVAGPIGAAIGGLVGIGGGIATGEAVERAAGFAATTTDARRPDDPDREPSDRRRGSAGRRPGRRSVGRRGSRSGG